MQDWEEIIKTSYSKDLEERKIWYSSAADAYNKVRPRYPQELIARVVELTQLPSEAAILEIGCGPGNATVGFAQLGFKMVCIEPNQEFCQLARQNCASYPNVEIKNIAFEDCQLENEKFNAVLAATSIHWISPDVVYPKAAETLQDNGYLILLWNMTSQPHYEVYQDLQEVYQIYAPSFVRYEDRNKQEEILQGLGQIVINSGKFQDLVSEHISCKVTYGIDDYLLLLNSLSPYLALDEDTRKYLFEGLREKIETNYRGNIQLSYLCAFQIAKKLK
jgi:SAM-dependent methyltransferase